MMKTSVSLIHTAALAGWPDASSWHRNRLNGFGRTMVSHDHRAKATV